MNTTTEISTLSRREALARAVALGMAVLPAGLSAKQVQPTPEPEFVPENDYPFFGGELPIDTAISRAAKRP